MMPAARRDPEGMEDDVLMKERLTSEKDGKGGVQYKHTDQFFPEIIAMTHITIPYKNLTDADKEKEWIEQTLEKVGEGLIEIQGNCEIWLQVFQKTVSENLYKRCIGQYNNFWKMAGATVEHKKNLNSVIVKTDCAALNDVLFAKRLSNGERKYNIPSAED